MSAEELQRRLGAGEIVTLDAAAWDAVRSAFEVVEEHDTQMRGMLMIVRGSGGLAAVEEPSDEQRVVRPLADEAAVRAFVEERLATYERMWDGCGCKVDYFN